jgi:hypothetical protein
MRNALLRSTIGLLILSTSLAATTVMKMDLPRLVSTSDHIVQGRVESIETRREQNKIYTYVSVVVDEHIKGNGRRTVLIKQLGGTFGNTIYSIAGMPHFRNGDQVILFLKARQDTAFNIVGMNQGKYEIKDDIAVTNVHGITLVDPGTGVKSDARFVNRVPVETLKNRIRELMR